MHDFNELMSAMSIDGIWQNNLITLFLRLDRMQLASLVYVSVSLPANCIFPTHHRIHIGLQTASGGRPSDGEDIPI